MKKFKLFIGMLLAVLLLPFFSPKEAKADTGPKPSVTIDFKNFEYDEYYVALLSTKGEGPWAERPAIENINSDDVEKAFYLYDEAGEYKYFGNYRKLGGGYNRYIWGYYPPKEFKILIYLEDTSEFVLIDQVLDRYAFHSYYTITNTGDSYHFSQDSYKVSESYKFGLELLNCVIRIVITIAIELGLGLLMKFNKSQMIALTIINVVTQILLNVGMNIIYFNSGILNMIFWFFIFEILIIIIEMIYGTRVLPKLNEHTSKGLVRIYVILANELSFILGGLIVLFVPGL